MQNKTLSAGFVLDKLNTVITSIYKNDVKDHDKFQYTRNKVTVSSILSEANYLEKQWGIDVRGMLRTNAYKKMTVLLNSDYIKYVYSECLNFYDITKKRFDGNYIDELIDDIGLSDNSVLFISNNCRNLIENSSKFRFYNNDTNDYIYHIGYYRNHPVYSVVTNDRFLIISKGAGCTLNYDNNSLSVEYVDDMANDNCICNMYFYSCFISDKDFSSHYTLVRIADNSFWNSKAEKFKRWKI